MFFRTFFGEPHDLWVKLNNRSNNTLEGRWDVDSEDMDRLATFPTGKLYSRMAPKAEKPETKGLRQRHRGLVSCAPSRVAHRKDQPLNLDKMHTKNACNLGEKTGR